MVVTNNYRSKNGLDKGTTIGLMGDAGAIVIEGATIGIGSAIAIPVAAGSSALIIDGLVRVGTGVALFRNSNENITNSSDKSNNKRHTPDQEALSDLAKEAERKGVTNEDADALLEWSEEHEFPSRDDRGKPIHWKGGEHIHINGKHIPIIN